MTTTSSGFYLGKKVLVTGGLGFIGSNLALALWKAGALVNVVDAEVEGCGANKHNLDEANGQIAVTRADIGDPALAELIAAQQVIFNLAGEISHTRSVLSPLRDQELNARSHLQFLETARKPASQARVVYASSRQIYGRPRYLPVDEDHPINPVDFNGVHKWAAENYHRLMSQIYGMETVSLRLTNVYGPRQALDAPQQGFIGTFITRALRGQELVVYGDGLQLRDMLHVDDAVEAFLAAGATPMPPGVTHGSFNIGGTRPIPLRDVCQAVLRAGSTPEKAQQVQFAPFPSDRKRIDIGSYHANDQKFRQWTGWKPVIEFEDGIIGTVLFYRSHAAEYLPCIDSAL